MKVGLYLGNVTPQIGGGYTFESGVLQALLKLKQESSHTFVLLGFDERPSAGITPDQIEYVSLRLTLSERLALKSSQFKSLATQSLKKLRYFALSNSSSGEDLFDQLIVRKLQAQEIHFLCYLGQSAYLTSEIPYLTIVWDLQHRLQPYFPEVSKGGEWAKRENFLRQFLQRASLIVVGTNTGRAEVERFYHVPPERIRILPHPTPQFALSPMPEQQQVLQKYGIPEGYLFYPAQFWPHKNHVLILKAVQLLRIRYQLEMPVVFVGSDMGNLAYIRSIVTEFSLESQVRYLGFVPQEDLAAMYRHAFALVYVSLFGPENLPPLEAFALECPVIAANVPGAQEQLGETAILVDPQNEENLAAVILQLHQNSDLRENLKRHGLERARSFTTTDFVKKLFSILDEFQSIRRCWP